MKTLEQVNKLVAEARDLSAKLSEMFMELALPMARNGHMVGTEETDRLHNLSRMAERRYRRRRELQADIRWPHRVAQRAKLAK